MVTQGATLSPEELVCVFFERVEQNTNEYAVLPYIRGLTERGQTLRHQNDFKTSTDTQPNASVTQRPTIRRKTNERYLSN